MKILSFLSLVVAASSALSACSHRQPAQALGTSKWFGTSEPSPGPGGGALVHRYRLGNGLTLLVLEDHSAPTFSYQTWFNVGSKDEDAGLTGLAHLFEHMMFKATKNHKDGEFDKILESAGVEGENAFTNRDYTAYVQSLPVTSRSDNLDLIASLESERMANLLVDDEVLNKEREVVQNERRFRNENSPDGQLYERIYEVAYKHHPYHWPVIGYEPDLRAAKAGQCEKFYKKFYAPNNAVIAVVGDVNADTALTTVEKYYGKLPSSPIERNRNAVESSQEGERSETRPMKTEVEKLVLAYHVPDGRHRDFPVLEVLRNILAVGKSSRLYRKLVDGGIATGVEIYNSEHKDPGLFIFFVNMQKGKTAHQALAAIDTALAEVRDGKVTQDELTRSVALLRYNVFDDLDSNHDKARFLGFYETVTGRFETGIEILNAVKTVKREDVARVMKAYFTRARRSILFGVPEKKLAARKGDAS